MQILNEDNFLDYCQAAYTNEHCIGIDEFLEDLKTLKYIKILLRKQISSKDINDMMLLNHFLSFLNVFETHAATQIIFYRFEDYYWSEVKTIFDFLGITPVTFTSGDKRTIYTDDIVANDNLLKRLKNLNIRRNV